MKEPPCHRCGRCCGPYFSLYVEEEDEERWAREGRKDILDRLHWEREQVRWDEEGPYNALTGERFASCVYLVRLSAGGGLCGIHSTKPVICSRYPPGSSELCPFHRFRIR